MRRNRERPFRVAPGAGASRKIGGMPNNVAQFQSRITFVDVDGNTQTSEKTVSVNYAAQVESTIDVPDTQASGTVYSVPFGTIAVDATGGRIENYASAPLSVKINGAAAASQTIPVGGFFEWANPTSAGSTPILAISLTTTAIQSGAGRIVTRVYGDPAP